MFRVSLAGAWFYGNLAIERELVKIRHHESVNIKLGAEALSSRIEFVVHDLIYLSRQSALSDAVEQPTQKNIANLTEDYSVFSESRGHYDQMRWIDQRGMERVRVDYQQGKSVIIPADKLQSKAQRYYFTDTIKLNRGEVFVSPLDLNIEQDRIVVPYKPMLRVATPVSDQQGNKRGIVILNYLGKDLLEAFATATAGIANHSMIINGDGYWLKSPNPDDEWGFMFNRPELNMQARVPAAWARIRHAESGQMELDDGLWTWETATPLHQQHWYFDGPASASSGGIVKAPQNYWKSVAHFPADALNEIRHEIWRMVAWIAGLMLLLLGMGSWLLIRTWEELGTERFKFKTVSDFAYDWETWIDPDGQYLYCSPSCARITGHSPDAFTSDQNLLLNITHPDDRMGLASHLQRHQASDAPCEFVFRIVLPDGQVKWLEHACQSVFGESGQFLGRRASNRDVTERMQGEAALQESHQKMDSLLNSMAEGAYGVDTNGNCTFANRSFLRILGYEQADELIGKHIHELIHHAHPDCSPYPASECQMYNAYRRNQEIHVSDEVFWHKDGVAIPVEYWSQPILMDGVMQGAVATFIDITERKQVEAELRIAATTFDSAQGMMVADANSVILRVNRAFTEITGYTAEEVVGQTPRLLKSGRHDADFYAAMWERIRRNGSWQGEIWNRRKNSELYPELLTITAVRDATGEITNYVATLDDITLRKEAEEQIRNLAFYDPLTKLPNRRLLNDRLEHTMTASKRSGRYGALMFLDLDNFKPLNDLYGHAAGDLLLVEVARRISGCVREADTVARFGGDEFVVMLSELDVDQAESTAQAGIVAEKILTALAEPYLLTLMKEGNAESALSYRCTSSIGVVLFINHEKKPDVILKLADAAMYKAKESGRNQICFNGANT